MNPAAVEDIEIAPPDCGTVNVKVITQFYHAEQHMCQEIQILVLPVTWLIGGLKESDCFAHLNPAHQTAGDSSCIDKIHGSGIAAGSPGVVKGDQLLEDLSTVMQGGEADLGIYQG